MREREEEREKERESVCVCVFVTLTLAVAQVLDLDAFLLLTGRLLHLAGVVIGTTVRGTHRVEADVGAVDVANTPVEGQITSEDFFLFIRRVKT